MRKVIVSMNVTLDGFMAGANGTLDWHFPFWNEEMTEYMTAQLQTADTILLGRLSYQVMADYWPHAAAQPLLTPAQSCFATQMNSFTKIVFSRTLHKASWQHTRIIRSHIKQQMLELKRQPGRDMVLLGSISIVQLFIRLGLIDEYRLWVHPVTVKQGTPLFRNNHHKTALQFLKAKSFSNGMVVLYYRCLPQQMPDNLYVVS
ncbi:MAG TPA: dihydrofolate reductase family protein [Chitinophaga sp.]|uniref:dihydrofolate reductase family protein n=1 Tax=Chitinophaga sp. TaxID=1869181 RepID=UPI002DC03710|nr:dihydrofolate reductase family protein [Chitinophaga sp.]HEU4552899.1 dihydrofolate reductase family protein [Chitinophaga sp.]